MKEKIIEKLILVYHAGVMAGVLEGKNIIEAEEPKKAEVIVCNIVADSIMKLYEEKEKEDLFPPVRTLDEFIKRNINDEYQTCEYCGKEFLADYTAKRCPDCVIANMGRRPEEEHDEGADY